MRCSITRDSSSCLCPARCPFRMRMYDSSDIRELIIKNHMRRSIRRRIVFSLYFISLKIYNYHIFRSQLIVFHTTWFNNKQTFSRSMPLTFPQVNVTSRTSAGPYLLYIPLLLIFQAYFFSFTQFFLYNTRALCHSQYLRSYHSYQIFDSTAALSIGRPFRYLSINSLNPLTPSGSGSRVLPSFPANTRLSRNSSRVSPSFLSTR